MPNPNYQTASAVLVAFKPQPDICLAPGTAGAKVFRTNGGSMALTKEPIQSNEIRRDQQRKRGKHGSRSVSGSYPADLSIGTFDDLFEALFKGTFDVALTITQATGALASITTTANTIVAAGGSWITAGLRVGDIIRLVDHATAANNGRNLRIIGLTASTITVADTLTANAVADNTFTITRPRKVIQGTTRRAFYIEEREEDIDGSEVFEWCRVSRCELAVQPNGMATVTFGFVGRNMDVLDGAQSPYFIDPVTTITEGLTALEMKIMLGTSEVVDLTGCTITMDRRAAGAPVIGSVLTPDVFENDLEVTGSVSGLRKDFTRTKQFLAENDLSLHLVFAENDAEPADFLSFFIPYVSIASATKSEIGREGPRTQSLDLLIGKDERGGAYDPCMVKFQTSTIA